MKETNILTGGRLTRLYDGALARWYRREPGRTIEPGATLQSVVLAQHYANFRIWGFEDQARQRDRGDSHISEAKRSIDVWNQRRNDLAERIDEFVLARLGRPAAAGELHSETAGMMVDRLSILSLKIRHMRRHATRQKNPALAAECAGKLAVLREQRRDLCGCLERLIADFAAGRRCFRMYRQFKQYNDPRLHPHLARRG